MPSRLRPAPVLLRLTEHATILQVAALHAVVEDELAKLDPASRRLLHVVVAGAHQARVRSLGMQYFQARFGEEPGTEERVTYAEGVSTADEARALIGKQRVDRALALAFFGDPNRLQRDVLGDATARVLAEMNLAAIA